MNSASGTIVDDIKIKKAPVGRQMLSQKNETKKLHESQYFFHRKLVANHFHVEVFGELCCFAD